jgi:hypothetical protein
MKKSKAHWLLLLPGVTLLICAGGAWTEQEYGVAVLNAFFGSIFFFITFACIGESFTPDGRVPMRRRITIAAVGFLLFIISPTALLPAAIIADTQGVVRAWKLQEHYDPTGWIVTRFGVKVRAATEEDLRMHDLGEKAKYALILVVWSGAGLVGLYVFVAAVRPGQSKTLVGLNRILT